MHTILRLTMFTLFATMFTTIAIAEPITTQLQQITPISKPTHDTRPKDTVILPARVYKYGDCTWIPALALAAGWHSQQIPKLIEIIKRESGCCPRIIGGDAVNADCTLKRVVSTTHRSDSGLLQINGVHWKQDHKQYAGAICKRMAICTQEPLLNPYTNLVAGKLLYDLAGWSPWNPINVKP